DTFGISVLEALSMGLPSIVPNDFPLTDYVTEGHPGLITVDFSDSSAVAETISDLSADGTKLAAHSAGAVKIVREKFSKESHCERLISIYDSLVS
ncbi:MAG: glycosyltransferase, partial [Thermoplasmataceae archaeon]